MIVVRRMYVYISACARTRVCVSMRERIQRDVFINMIMLSDEEKRI